MHIHVDDQESGATLTLCVERETHTCIVLRGDITLLDKALAIAASMKVGVTRMFVHQNAVEELRTAGWEVVDDLVVVEQRFSKGVNPDGAFKTSSGLMR